MSTSPRTDTDRPAPSVTPDRPRDRGAVLPLILVMVVIGSLLVIPVMSYAVTVLRANSVLSDQRQRYEAVEAGLHTALYDPLELYRQCDSEFPTSLPALPPITVNGVQVSTTCQLVGYANTVLDDHLRYGLAVTEAGQTIPAALKGKKYQGALDANAWNGLVTPVFEDPGNTDAWDKVWVPDLPTYPRTVRSRLEGYSMPAGYNKDGKTCKVYFPGTYTGDVLLNGPTFFTSGIYYFEGKVEVVGGANVTVGDGRIQGCATSQEAVFFADPPLPSGEPHNITGFGATWLFGGAGRLVVSNANNQPLTFEFNRRYVVDPKTDPSLFVSIASVNGRLAADGVTYSPYVDREFVNVPMSRVMINETTVETPIQHSMKPSTLTEVARVPWAPVLNPVVTYRAAGSDLTVAGNNGAAYVTWQPLPADKWGGVPILKYEVFVRGEATPRCSVNANAQQLLPDTDVARQRLNGVDRLECRVTNLLGAALTATNHTIDVVAVNAIGKSAPASATVTYRNGLVSPSPAVHAALPAPSGTPTTTRYNGSVRVTWTPLAPAASITPVTHYTVTAKVQGTPAIADKTCVTNTRTATSCIVTGLTSTRNWRFTVTATNLAGMTSVPSTSTADVMPNSGTMPNPDPNNPAATVPTAVTPPPALNTAAIVDLDLPSTASSSIRIPGYVAVPQGTLKINNPNGSNIKVVGGMLAARMQIVDGRTTTPACTAPAPPAVAGQDCIDLGFESESVQKRVRIVSTTSEGHESSVALVQVNENGNFAVNSWEVQ